MSILETDMPTRNVVLTHHQASYVEGLVSAAVKVVVA